MKLDVTNACCEPDQRKADQRDRCECRPGRAVGDHLLSGQRASHAVAAGAFG